MRDTISFCLSRFKKSIVSLVFLFLLAGMGLQAQTYVHLGASGGGASHSNSDYGPINIWYRSLHMQVIYTAAEIHAQGIMGEQIIEQLGFYVTQVPSYSLPNYTIYMKHTTDLDADSYDGTGLSQVFYSPSYTPTAGSFNMLTLDTPFEWNGTDNILVDICFSQVPTYTTTGTVLTYTDNGYGLHAYRSDGINTCGVATTTDRNYRPQVQFLMMPVEGIVPVSLVSPIHSSCGRATDSVTVEILNNLDYAISNVPVNITITNPNGTTTTLNGTYNGVINPQTTETLTLGNINTTATGEYKFRIVTQFPNAVNHIRNTTVVTQSDPYKSRYSVNFSSVADLTFWRGINMDYDEVNGYVMSERIDNTNTATGFTPKLQLYSTLSAISFDLYVETNLGGGTITAEDHVYVDVSTNCGTSYTNIAEITAGDYFGGWQNFVIPLDQAAISGSVVTIRFRGVTDDVVLSDWMQFGIDNFAFWNDFDFGVTNLRTTADVCNGSATDTIYLDVTDYGANPLTTVPVEVQIRDRQTKVLIQTIPVTVNMASPANVYVGTFNSTVAGTYEIYASTLLNDANNANNDDAIYKNTSGGIGVAMPLVQVLDGDFDDESGNYWDNFNTAYMNNDSVRMNLNFIGEYGYITSPQFSVNAGSTYSFAYKVQSQNGVTMDWVPYMGVGDSIIVRISTDCGNTWNDIAVVDSAQHLSAANLRVVNVNLSAYAGQSVFVMLYAKHEQPAGSEITYFRPIFDFIKVLDAPDYDFAVTEVIASNRLCGDAGDAAYVVIRNAGASSPASIPVNLNVQNPYGEVSTISASLAGPLAYGAIDTLAVTVNTEILGTYEFYAEIALSTDNYSGNNSAPWSVTKSYSTAINVPEFEDLESGEPVYWQTNGQFFYTGSAYASTLADGQEGTLLTSRYANIEADDYLYFDYYVLNDLGTDEISVDEFMYIQIANSCNAAFVNVDTINEASHLPTGIPGTRQRIYIPLSAYNGNQIFVRFASHKIDAVTYSSFTFVIDNFGIGKFYDAGARFITLSNNTCGDENDEVTVSVENYGMEDLTNIPVRLTMHFDNWDYHFMDTLASLEAGAIADLTFTGINTSYPGNYAFTATTLLDTDIDNSNNSVTTSAETLDRFALPFYANNWTAGVAWNYINAYQYSSGAITTQLIAGNQASMTSKQIGSVTANSKLSFNYYVYNYEPEFFANNYRLGTGDTIDLQISTDCGITYTTLKQFHAGNVEDLGGSYKLDTLSLAAFTGENINIRFLARKHDILGSSTQWFQFFVNNLAINNGADVGATDLITQSAYCSSVEDTVWVEVYNYSGYPVSNVPVVLAVSAPTGEYYEMHDTIASIAPLSVDTAIFLVNTSVSTGEYNFEAWTAYELDDNLWNNYIGTYNRYISNYTYAPFIETFTNDNPEWDYIDFNRVDYLYSDVYAGDRNVVVSPKITGLTAGLSRLEFDYMVQAFDNSSIFIDNGIDEGDTLQIWISTDCGETFQQIDAITKASHIESNEYQAYGVDLSAYIGNDIILAIVAVNNELNLDARAYYRLNIDNFEITNGIDVGITEIIRPSTVANCGNSTEPISVMVKNFGSLPQSNIPVTLEVYKSDEDVLLQTLTATLAGPLAGNESAELFVGNVNTSVEGTYEFHAFTSLAGDSVNGSYMNNHTDDVLLVQDFINTPFTHTFDYGTTPTGYVLENMYNNYWLIHTSSVLVSGDTAIMGLPKFGPVAEGQFLSFAYYAESDAPDYGMSAEDSVLVQISTDCGGSYTTVLVIDSTNYFYTSDWVLYNVDLSAYVGMDINVRIVGFKYPSQEVYNNYFDYYIDNVSWGVSDAGISDVYISGVHDPACGTEEVPVYVTVYNYGNLPISDIPVTVEFTFTNYDDYLLNFVLDTVLLGGQSYTFVADTINTTMEGDYHVDAYTTSAIDNNAGNNAGSDDAYTTVSQQVPFTWCPYYTYNDVQYLDTIEITVPYKFGTIAANHMVGIYYYYESEDNSGTEIGNYMRTGDKIEILISTDCGANYDVVQTIDMNNHHNNDYYTMVGESLAAYAGQTIWSKVRFVKGEVGQADFNFGCYAIDYANNAAIDDVEWLTNADHRVCGSANDSVLVVVYNDGLNELTSIPVKVIMYYMGEYDIDYVKVDSTEAVYTGSLLYNTYDTLWVSGFNTEMPGYYMFEAMTTLASDSVDNGPVYEYGNVAIPHELPFMEHFAWYQTWYYGEWYNETNNGNTDFDINYNNPGRLMIDNNRNGDTAFIVSPSIGLIDAASMFEMSYMVEAWDLSSNQTGNYLRPGDAINIIVSDDCFASETVIHTIDATNHPDTNAYVKLVVPLTNFAGSNIIVKVEVIKGEIGELDLDIDYISISNPDVGIEDLYTYTSLTDNDDLCGTTIDSVYAEIANYGLYAVTNIPVQFVVDGNATSLTYTGTLEPGTSDSLFLGTVPTVVDQVVEVIAFTNLATDINTSNDSVQYRITRQPVQVPYRAFTKDWVFDEWIFSEMYRSGTFGIQSYWVDGADNYGTIDSAWAVTPTITGVTDETYLVFDYYLDIDMITHFIFNEQVIVEVSTDCGATFTKVNVTAVNNIDIDVDIWDIYEDADYGTAYADLSAFEGQDIIIKISLITGRSEDGFDMYMEDIKVINLPVHRPSIHQPIETIVCNSKTYEFSTLGLPQAELYNWVLTPDSAGSIKGNGSIVEVTFNKNFYGPLTLTVQGLIEHDAILGYDDRNLWGDTWNYDGYLNGYKFINGYTYYPDGTVRSAFSLPLELVADACLTGNDETGMDRFTIYPNPTAGLTNLELPGISGMVEINVVGMKGEIVYTDKLAIDQAVSLDLSNLAEGIYYVELNADNNVYRQIITIRK
ncbi:MAG: T9SS type A sorting domain-containing protein [Bacteroidales bacterium]|nr:T9SS type A sorting domain-containing protein [Bacteroidales bacterium]